MLTASCFWCDTSLSSYDIVELATERTHETCHQLIIDMPLRTLSIPLTLVVAVLSDIEEIWVWSGYAFFDLLNKHHIGIHTQMKCVHHCSGTRAYPEAANVTLQAK